jgi:hypothetical protein
VGGRGEIGEASQVDVNVLNVLHRSGRIVLIVALRLLQLINFRGFLLYTFLFVGPTKMEWKLTRIRFLPFSYF